MLMLSDWHPRAFGGAPLQGSRVLRLIYADESGVSARDPLAVVAAVLVQPDGPWIRLEKEIEALKQEVPEKYRKDFVFRASDLLTPREKVYEEKFWPRKDRIELLCQLLTLPRQHQIPIAVGFCVGPAANELLAAKKIPIQWCHAMAYALALSACDTFIHQYGEPDEIGMLFSEDTQSARQTIKTMHEALKDKAFIQETFPERLRSGFPITRIKDTLN